MAQLYKKFSSIILPAASSQLSVPEPASSGSAAGPTSSSYSPESAYVAIFVNSGSGGQKGNDAIKFLQQAHGEDLVFDLKKDRGPAKGINKVLKAINVNPQEVDVHDLKDTAQINVNKVRVMVCGGDGTFNWVASYVQEMKLNAYVILCPVPLGTGNDMGRCLGWGIKYPGTANLLAYIEHHAKADPVVIDGWRLRLLKKENELHRRQQSEALTAIDIENIWKLDEQEARIGPEKRDDLLKTSFFNYFSLGVDALIELKFNEARWKNPEQYASRFKNLAMHGVHGAKHVVLEHKIILREMLKSIDIDNVPCKIPKGIQSIICLNITSYGGGVSPWGISGSAAEGAASAGGATAHDADELQPSFINDRKIEVLGLKGLSHFVGLRLGINGVRIGQGKTVRIVFDTESHGIPVQTDGEPWFQKGGILEISPSPGIYVTKGPFHKTNVKTHAKFVPDRELKFATDNPHDTVDSTKKSLYKKTGSEFKMTHQRQRSRSDVNLVKSDPDIIPNQKRPSLDAGKDQQDRYHQEQEEEEEEE